MTDDLHPEDLLEKGRNDLTFTEICERFEISRKLGYKWRALSPMSPTEHRRERAMPKITLEAFV